MNTYEKCVCNDPEMSTSKITGLKPPLKSTLVRKGEGGGLEISFLEILPPATPSDVQIAGKRGKVGHRSRAEDAAKQQMARRQRQPTRLSSLALL